jgi:hypothetical protein
MYLMKNGTLTKKEAVSSTRKKKNAAVTKDQTEKPVSTTAKESE